MCLQESEDGCDDEGEDEFEYPEALQKMALAIFSKHSSDGITIENAAIEAAVATLADELKIEIDFEEYRELFGVDGLKFSENEPNWLGVVDLFWQGPAASDEDIAADKHAFGFPADRVHVFIAGFVKFEGDTELHWTDERLDHTLAAHFTDTVGVPRDQVCCLTDEQGSLHNVRAMLESTCQRAVSGDLLFFYWGSHGSKGATAPNASFQTKAYDGWISASEIMETLDTHYEGDHAFMISDACYSGSFAEYASDFETDFEVASISSTSSEQTAWSGWKFARCFLDAFTGKGHIYDYHLGCVSDIPFKLELVMCRL